MRFHYVVRSAGINSHSGILHFKFQAQLETQRGTSPRSWQIEPAEFPYFASREITTIKNQEEDVLSCLRVTVGNSSTLYIPKRRRKAFEIAHQEKNATDGETMGLSHVCLQLLRH